LMQKRPIFHFFHIFFPRIFSDACHPEPRHFHISTKTLRHFHHFNAASQNPRHFNFPESQFASSDPKPPRGTRSEKNIREFHKGRTSRDLRPDQKADRKQSLISRL